jgi:hypothetical protein
MFKKVEENVGILKNMKDINRPELKLKWKTYIQGENILKLA